jgi:hypothetical protein
LMKYEKTQRKEFNMIIPGRKFMTTKKIQLSGPSKILSIEGEYVYEVLGVGGEVKDWTIGDRLVVNQAYISTMQVGKEIFHMVHEDYVLGKVAVDN